MTRAVILALVAFGALLGIFDLTSGEPLWLRLLVAVVSSTSLWLALDNLTEPAATDEETS